MGGRRVQVAGSARLLGWGWPKTNRVSENRAWRILGGGGRRLTWRNPILFPAKTSGKREGGGGETTTPNSPVGRGGGGTHGAPFSPRQALWLGKSKMRSCDKKKTTRGKMEVRGAWLLRAWKRAKTLGRNNQHPLYFSGHLTLFRRIAKQTAGKKLGGSEREKNPAAREGGWFGGPI